MTHCGISSNKATWNLRSKHICIWMLAIVLMVMQLIHHMDKVYPFYYLRVEFSSPQAITQVFHASQSQKYLFLQLITALVAPTYSKRNIESWPTPGSRKLLSSHRKSCIQ